MFINKLKELLEFKKITQKELCERIDFSETSMSQALSRGDFKVSLLEKIAKTLEVPIEYFFTEDKVEGSVKQVANGHGNNLKVVMNSDDDVKELKAKIKGLEIQVTLLEERIKDKDELINILKEKR